jgi:zinc finger FYVE domain-containing protein 26
VIPILTNAVQLLTQKNQFRQVKHLLRRAKDLLLTDDVAWDQFVHSSVKKFVALGQAKSAEKLIPFITKDENRIESLIICGKLKTAYLLAVKTNQKDKVALIRDEAKSKNFMTEYRLCVQYLALADDASTKQP